MHVFTVEGLSCGHCVKAVTTAIQGLDAQAQVTVDLAHGEVRVDSSHATDALVAVITTAGYAVVAVA